MDKSDLIYDKFYENNKKNISEIHINNDKEGHIIKYYNDTYNTIEYEKKWITINNIQTDTLIIYKNGIREEEEKWNEDGEKI